MLYRLLGMAVWKGGNSLVRTKYGVTIPQAAAIAGAGLVLAGLGLGAARRGGRSGQLTP